MARIDTHQLIKDLIEGGLAEKPSEILGKAFFSSSNVESFASKEQFAHLEKEQSDIKTDLTVIKQTMATKSDISKLENKMDILETKMDINMKWIMAIGALIVGLLLKDMFFK